MSRRDWELALAGAGAVRASRAYRLRPLDALPEASRVALGRLGVDATWAAGVLVADPGSGLGDKVADAAAADLFTRLDQPARSPDGMVDRLARLVFDGVLEVRGPSGFVSGPQAYDMLGPLAHSSTGDDVLGRLARAALEYAERLRLPDVDTATTRLYGYNRVPLSERWTRLYPGPEAVLDLLPRRTLAERWMCLPPDGRPPHWLSWISTSWAGGALPYKLYVSPRPEDLPDVLPPLVDALTASGAPRFKIGAGAYGLLRPDKAVVYLAGADQTGRVAEAVFEAVAGARPHGVPFSAELAGDGLLSWGGDPPRDAGPVGRRAESWRLSVCRRLAEHLVAARRAGWHGRRAVDFALAGVATDGVDVRSFAPSRLGEPVLAARP